MLFTSNEPQAQSPVRPARERRGSVRMQRVSIAALLASAVILSGAPGRATAPESAVVPVLVPVTLGEGSSLWIEGTSTVHDFESRTKDVKVTLKGAPQGAAPIDAAGLALLIKSSAIQNVEVLVPVATLRSGKDGLDKNLRKSMRADEFPSVRFQLDRYTLAASASADTIPIKGEGKLTIAGKQNPVTLDARLIADGRGLWLEGSKVLKMSEYGIKPPTMMMGTLRVGDPITVRYRLKLVPGGDGSTTAPHGN